MRAYRRAKTLPYGKAMAFAYFSMAKKCGFRNPSLPARSSFQRRMSALQVGRMKTRLGIRPDKYDPSLVPFDVGEKYEFVSPGIYSIR